MRIFVAYVSIAVALFTASVCGGQQLQLSAADSLVLSELLPRARSLTQQRRYAEARAAFDDIGMDAGTICDGADCSNLTRGLADRRAHFLSKSAPTRSARVPLS